VSGSQVLLRVITNSKHHTTQQTRSLCDTWSVYV